METKKKEKEQPKLWYWCQPEEGLSIEDCEEMVKEFVKRKSLVIMFV